MTSRCSIGENAVECWNMSLKSSDIFTDVRSVKEERDFLKVTGSDSLRFLQGMWTSDVQLMDSQPLSASRSLLLSLKARPFAIATFVFDGRDASQPCHWLSVPKGTGQAVFEALDKYLVADDVEIEVSRAAEAPFSVFTLWGGALPVVSDSRIEPRVAADPATVFRVETLEDIEGALLVPVGRLHATACEVWIPSASETPAELSGENQEEYTQLRIKKGIPAWGDDYDQDSLVLEYPFEEEISFHKGCYIGQEVVARGSYRGRVAKSFVRFSAESDLSPGFVFDASDPVGEGVKPVGKITTAAGTQALGQLRLREFESKKFELRLEGKSIPIRSVDLLALKVPD